MRLFPSSSTTSSCPLLQEDLTKASRYENIPLTAMWQDIQGANSWNGLLDPINPVFKAEILRYGDFAQLCYDAFDIKLSTNDLGGCKYSLDKLFESCERPAHSGTSCSAGYEVTKYLYAETDALGRPVEQSVWIGFIAVCTDAEEIRRLGRRDIVVAWRGTETRQEWIQDARDILVPARLSFSSFMHNVVKAGFPTTPRLRNKVMGHRLPSTVSLSDMGVRVEKGFLSCYISKGEDSRCARDTVISEILRLVDKFKDESLSVTLTGHSLGAALATLSSYDIKKFLNSNFPERPLPVTAFAFASPRIGNRAFAMRMGELGVKVLRLVNKRDVVPKVPGFVFNENSWRWLTKLLDWLPWTYCDVGVKIVLDNNDIRNLDPAYAHNLVVYRRLIEGYVGVGRPFKSLGAERTCSTCCGLLIEDQIH